MMCIHHTHTFRNDQVNFSEHSLNCMRDIDMVLVVKIYVFIIIFLIKYFYVSLLVIQYN